MTAHLLPFVGVSIVVVVTPGVDMALVTKNALRHGRPAAIASALGVNAGVAVWTVAAAFGVAAVVQASAVAFTAVKFAGAAFLAYLGLQALRSGRGRGRTTGAPRPAQLLSRRDAFRQGLVSNALNPKIAVFFTSLLPQFVGGGDRSLVDLLLLGGVFNLIGIVWLTTYAVVAARGRGLLQRPRIQAALDYVSGIVLVGLGVRIALERRP